MSTHLKDGMTTESTGQPVTLWLTIHLRNESQQELIELKNFYREYIGYS